MGSKDSFAYSLTTILSAAARFIAPSISTTLAQDVAEYSVQAIFGDRKTVETVQAWMMVGTIGPMLELMPASDLLLEISKG
jgi:hypothetical protein